MKLATFRAPDSTAPRAGEIRGDDVVAFTSGTVLDRIATNDRTPATGEVYPLADVTLLEPIPRPPAIFCIGRNYADHIAEMGPQKPRKAPRLPQPAALQRAPRRPGPHAEGHPSPGLRDRARP